MSHYSMRHILFLFKFFMFPLVCCAASPEERATDLSEFSNLGEIINDIQKGFQSQVMDQHKCSNIWVTNKTKFSLDYSRESSSNLVLSQQFLLEHHAELSKILQKVSVCPTAIVLDDNTLTAVLQVMNKFREYIAIKLGGLKPENDDVVHAKQPVVWIDHKNKKMNLLHTFCPKEDRRKSRWLHDIIPFNGFKVTNKCPHFLSGLNLARGGVYSKNYKIINGKKVHGSYEVRIFEYLSIKFGYIPSFVHGFSGRYNPKNNSWNGIMGQLVDSKLFVASASLRELMGKHFDLTIPYIEDPFHYVTAEPKILVTYDSLLLPLNPVVWATVMASLMCTSIMFYVIYHTYSSHVCLMMLLRNHGKYQLLTFPLYTICKFKDPASIPWFRRTFSTGRFMTFQYIVFCFIITAMYCCNLHAHLVAVGREKPIDTAQDVIDNRQRPWIMTEMGVFTKAVAERSGLAGTKMYKILEMAEEQDGYYSYHKSRGFPETGLKDVMNNRAVAVTNARMHHDLFLPRYNEIREGNRLYVSREAIYKAYFCQALKKHSPVFEEVNHAVLDAIETGLVHYWHHEKSQTEGTGDVTSFVSHGKLPSQSMPIHVKHFVMPLSLCGILWLVALLTLLKEKH